jgi:hypothetical protein
MPDAQRPTRRHLALLGFLLKGELDAILSQTSFELPDASVDPSEAWRQASEARRRLPPLPAAELMPLPPELQDAAARVRERPAFRRYYERVAEYEFGLAPIGLLLTPQFAADADYVDEIAISLGDDLSLDRVFDFSMPSGRLTPPIVMGNAVIFSSSRLDLFASPVPQVVPSDSGGSTIKIEAESRPNLVQVAVLGQRLVLTNGVHKALALRKRGLDAIPCVWRHVGSADELGLPQANLDMFRPHVLGGERPALLADFTNAEVALELVQPATNQVLRVVVNVETMSVPLPIPAADT